MSDQIRQPSARAERARDPTRGMALSDGVFAIVITLLVLEIRVPDLADGQGLEQALDDIRPSFIAFLISFVVTTIAWAGHRDLFALVRRTDQPLVWLNVAYLLPLSILPFGASLISRYDTDPVALGIYGSILLSLALTRLAIWSYATSRPDLLDVAVDMRTRRRGIVVAGVAVVVYLAAIGLADAAPRASLAIYAAAPILYFAGVARNHPG